MLPISHDEVVHGKGSMLRKMPGDRWQQLANLRAFLAYMWAHPGKQLIFMGTEFGQEAEWSEQHGLDWWLADIPAHRGMQLLTKDLNELYRVDAGAVRAGQRAGRFPVDQRRRRGPQRPDLHPLGRDGNPLVCAINFSGGPHTDYRARRPRRRGLAGSAQHRCSGLWRLGCANAGTADCDGRRARRSAGHAHRDVASAGRCVLQAAGLGGSAPAQTGRREAVADRGKPGILVIPGFSVRCSAVAAGFVSPAPKWW